jgi:hypothetical protein
MSGVSVASKGYWKGCKVVAAEPVGTSLAPSQSRTVPAPVTALTTLCPGPARRERLAQDVLLGRRPVPRHLARRRQPHDLAL